MTTSKTIARYQVLNPLDAGGMGQVVLARDPAIDRLVAIKLLKEGFDNAELRERFMREARSAGRLRHVNIVTIFDVGEHDNQPFIAMEYVEGETLHALIKRKAAISIGRKLELMDQLCAGLQYAHRGGIVHRDIKPKNVMLDADGVLKVLDFGIARVTDAGGGGIKTQAGMLMGTLNYMSPEQMMGLPDIDARADMFSAGAVFYELLTYHQAFPGGLESGILHKIINVNPEPMRRLDPRLDSELVALVEKCLEKAKENRYPDMAAVQKDIAKLRRRLGADLDQDASAETLTGARPFEPDEGTPRPGRRDSSRQELARLRAAQIKTHLDDARKALEASDFTAALEASQRALLLNGDERDALAYEHRARTALDERQAQQLLAEARLELDKGALTAASLLVGRAESLSPASREAEVVRAALEEARQELIAKQARARALEAALGQARNALSGGNLEAAADRVRDALAIDAANPAAKAIEGEIAAAVEARRRAAEQARAREATQAARERFARGDYDEAVAELARFDPQALVADAVGELQIERDEIRRREAERLAEERRKAAEAAERTRQETLRTLADATARLEGEEFDAAAAIVAGVLRDQPQLAEARALETRIQRAIELRRTIDAGLRTARGHIDANRFDEARRAIADLEALAGSRRDVVAVRTALDAAEERLRLEREAAEQKRLAELEAKRQAELAAQKAAEEQKRRDAELAARAAEERRKREAELTAQKAAEEQKRRDAELAARAAEEKRRDAEVAARAAEERRKREAELTAQKAAEERKRRDAELASRRAAELAAQRAEQADATVVRPRDADATLVRPRDGDATIVATAPVATRPAPKSAVAGDDPTVVLPRGPVPVPAPVSAPAPTGRVEPVPARGRAKWVGLGGAALLLLGIGAWVFGTRQPDVPSTRPPVVVPVTTGSVVLDIAPWANIDAVTTKADGKPASSACAVTPCVLTLPAGDYHVRASNPNFPGALEFDVTVEPSGVRQVRQTIPGFKVDDEISKILDK